MHEDGLKLFLEGAARRERTKDGLDLVGRQCRLGQSSLAVNDAGNRVRGQAVSVIQASQQLIGQLLGCGPCVAALQQLCWDNLEGRVGG